MKKVPKVIGVRIFLIAWLLSFLLVLPYLLVTFYHKLPDFLESKNVTINNIQGKVSDSIAVPNDTFVEHALSHPLGDIQASHSLSTQSNEYLPKGIGQENRSKLAIGDKEVDTIHIKHNFSFNLNQEGIKDTGSNSIVFLSYLLSIVSLLYFIYPIKKYFKGLRKGPLPSEDLRAKVKKRIYSLPIVATFWYLLPWIVGKSSEVYFYIFAENKLEILDSVNYSKESILTGIVAELVTAIFVYQWFQYKVETQYLEHILSVKELIHKDRKFFTGKIKNRLWTSSLMTTLLPILIVFLYIAINVSYLPRITQEAFSEDVNKIIWGEYLARSSSLDYASIPAWVFYFNIPNSFLMVFGMMSSMLVAFIYVFFFIRWTTARIILPIHELLDKMHLVQKGDFSQYTYIRTPDEMGRLTSGYNEMLTKLGVYFKDINEMKESYRRFVPQQILDFLGKEKFADIQLGDQVEKEMSVMFTDIRDFTSISEKMTPQQNFTFINTYLSYMEPVISKHNGFIDKYIGDAIMALFPESADDAVMASLEMLERLEAFNQYQNEAGRPSINIGVGIHTGLLMLGVIGGANRMEGTVISDAVNLASRLEGLTKKYKRKIIISDSTKNKMNEADKFQLEFLGETKVKGKEQSTEIYAIVKMKE